MSRFIRDKGDRRRNEVMEMFDMAEFCQVFLTAHYIRNGDDSYIPLIQRGRLDKMPSEVADEMDAMLKLAVIEIEKMGNDPKAFIESRGEDYDPVSDFIDTPEMKDALGNTIMRRLRITEGLHDEEEAYERAKELMPEVRDALHAFVAGNLSQTMYNLVKELHQKGLHDLSRVSELVEPKVAMIDDRGIAFSIDLDRKKLDEILGDSKDKEETKVKYDPAWG